MRPLRPREVMILARSVLELEFEHLLRSTRLLYTSCRGRVGGKT